MQIGTLRERITIETADPAVLRLSSLTAAAGVATAVTLGDHGYATGDVVTVAEAVESSYNATVLVTVTDDQTFTYPVSGSPSSPATGAPTVTYVSDAQGGRRDTWREIACDVPAELMPWRAGERLQLAAIQSLTEYRFRIRVRDDVSPEMRIRWTPRWPPCRDEKTLQIHAVQPVGDGLRWLLLEAGGLG